MRLLQFSRCREFKLCLRIRKTEFDLGRSGKNEESRTFDLRLMHLSTIKSHLL